MRKSTSHPLACPDCLISERVGISYRCKFYGRAYMSNRPERPPYCRIKSIVVEEDRKDESHQPRR